KNMRLEVNSCPWPLEELVWRPMMNEYGAQCTSQLDLNIGNGRQVVYRMLTNNLKAICYGAQMRTKGKKSIYILNGTYYPTIAYDVRGLYEYLTVGPNWAWVLNHHNKIGFTDTRHWHERVAHNLKTQFINIGKGIEKSWEKTKKVFTDGYEVIKKHLGSIGDWFVRVWNWISKWWWTLLVMIGAVIGLVIMSKAVKLCKDLQLCRCMKGCYLCMTARGFERRETAKNKKS
ncbi:MAG: hypothetical protein ACRC31_04890, partial [Cetobacterium sp.]